MYVSKTELLSFNVFYIETYIFHTWLTFSPFTSPWFLRKVIWRQDFVYYLLSVSHPHNQMERWIVMARFSAGNQATWLWPLSSLTFMWNEWLEELFLRSTLGRESPGLASELWIISSPLTNEGTLWWSVSFTEYHCPALCEATGSNFRFNWLLWGHILVWKPSWRWGFCKPVIHDGFVKWLQTVRMWPLLTTTCIPVGSPSTERRRGSRSQFSCPLETHPSAHCLLPE